MRVARRLFTAALLAAAAPAAASAQTRIWENGTPLDFQPAPYTLRRRVIADDFTFAAATSIGAVRFWSYAITGAALNHTGTIHWQLLDDAGGGGAPGALLASGEAAPASTYEGVLTGLYDVYRFDFTIPTQPLGAGTYWLALHDGAATDFGPGGSPYWLITGSPGNGLDIRDYGFPDPQPLNAEFAFELYTPAVSPVPEPATVALTAGGLALVGLLGRRRARRS